VSSNTVVRDFNPVTKEKAKALVAAGLHRAVVSHGLEVVAQKAGCSPRCLQKALSHETLPEMHTAANVLLLDMTALCEFFAALGFQITPSTAAMSPDMMTVKRLSETLSCYLNALQDGRRDHRETLQLAEHLRPLIAELTALVREADGLRSVA
jgi:DNA-binding phage protein